MQVDVPPPVEAVIVRAAELPTSPADAAFSVASVPQEVLRTAPRLDEALSQIPGFAMYRRLSSLGANPTTQGVTLRDIAGSAASRALVTLDGAPVNDPFGGWVIFTALPPEAIGGVTVVRGAGSGPYGAGALTGVVSLVSPAARAGSWTTDAEAGSLSSGRVAGEGTYAFGPILATLAASAESSGGWDPIRAGRGPADSDLWLHDYSGSVRLARDLGRVTTALRLGAYEEERGAGQVDAGSRARGLQASLGAEADPTPAVLGWRAQAWLLASDLSNTSVTVPLDQSTATLADNQFQTPALGVGGNAELRKIWSEATLEAGIDVRADGGEDRETMTPVKGVLTRLRKAGGEAIDAGAYVEASERLGRLLLAQGARIDDWRTFAGHDVEGASSGSGPQTVTRFGPRTGALPSVRLAGRYDLDDAVAARLAGYTGFRTPTLNELFRTFRQGSNVTEANPALTPERLYGVEGGLNGQTRRWDWDLTAFYNRLDDPVTNVTLRNGPTNDPIAGVVPLGGALLQRRNVGAVDAVGVEADSAWRVASGLMLRAAFDWTRARVDGGSVAPRLDGLQPAETPEFTASGALDAQPLRRLRVLMTVRYESRRWANDQNTLPLTQAVVVDARMEWAVSRRLTLFVSAENLLDAAVEQNEAVGGLYSYGPPRIVSAGARLATPG